MKQKLEKWDRDIRRIRNAVMRLCDYRRWNRVYEAIVNANPGLHPGVPVLDYFRDVYGDYALMAIRRQAKPHKDAISLRGLLEDIALNPSLISRRWTQQLYMEPLEGSGHVYPEETAISLADSTFRDFADDSGEFLRQSLVTGDLAKLEDATAKIIDVSDRAIAHDDRRGPEFEINFDQINRAVDVIEELTRRYNLLLTGASMLRLTPHDTTNAISVFRFPWIDPSNPPDFGQESI